MPAPLARGIIITVSVIVAAGIAAYENPAVREWVERSREKIATAWKSLGDEPRSPTPRRDDPSMREEQGEKAEERRRQMRDEILERGRRMEERMKNRKTSSESVELSEKKSPTFDTMVDSDGMLKPLVPTQQASAVASGAESQDTTGTLRSRKTDQQQDNMHQSVDAPMLLRQFGGAQADAIEPWESQYERELRDSWHMPVPEWSAASSSHASESLLDLTPTTENFPDPDVSIPSASDLGHPLDRSDYFSFPASRSSHTVSDAGEAEYYYAHPNQPMTPLDPRPMSENNGTAPGSSAASVAGSAAHVHASDLESESEFSDFGDGVRTPASAWTEVGSTVSADD